MASFNALPMELVTKIVRAALVCNTSHLPTIGLDATYFIPHYTELGSKDQELGLVESIDGVLAAVSLSLTTKAHGPYRTPSQPPFGFCLLTRSLRL
jgi:hypothetical protein